MKKGLILGIGNSLMGDEGVGPHLIRLIEKERLPEGWESEDGGTGGFHLLGFFQDFKTIILVDASLDDYPDGTVRLIRPRFASDYPVSLSAHDIGLHDLVQSAQLLGYSPEIYLFAVSVTQFQSISDQLTGPILEKMPDLATRVLTLARDLSRSEVTAGQEVV